MRIGIDARLIGGQFTGDRTYWSGLLTGLATPKISEQHDYVLYVRDALSVPDINALTLPSNFSWRVVESRSDRSWSIIDLPKAAKRDNLDIVHVQYTVSPFFSVPVVTTVHDISFRLFPELFKPKDRLFLNTTVPFSVRKAQAVIGVSDNTCKDLIQAYGISPSKVFTTHLAANSRFSQLSKIEAENARVTIRSKYGIDGPYILAVGVLQPRKNLPMLARAFKTAKVLAGFKHKLVVTGKQGWLTEETNEELTQKPGVENSSIILTGYVPDEDLPLLYNCADLFCYPSLYEGFGFPPLEAMACGCPVLVSNVSSLPEVVGDAGIKLDPTNPGAWIDAICQTLESESRSKELSALGLVQASQFDWVKTAEATLLAYKFAKSSKRT